MIQQHDKYNLFPAATLLLGLLLISWPLCTLAAEGGKAEGMIPAAAVPKNSGNAIRVLLAAAQETILASRIQGVIASMTVSHGASFTKDKVLVTFDCGEQSARLAMAEAEMATARENYQGKVRMQGLQQASEIDVALAAGALSRTKAQVNLYRIQTDQCTIKAPFNGRVVKQVAKPYQSVSQGQPLLEIVAAGPLLLRLNVPATWLSWIKPGESFKVRIDETGTEHEAKVTALNGRVDAVSQTIEIEGVLVKEAQELLPGMSGTALFARSGN